mgnify:FL=1
MKAHRPLFAFLALAIGVRLSAQPLVVAANPVLADIVRQVAGTTVRVETLLPPDTLSREFEPTDETAQKLGDAALFVVNGADYEPWLEQFLKVSRYKGALLGASEGVALYDQAGTLHQPDAEETGKNLFEVTDFDPFAWHDPRNVVTYAESIARAIGGLVPTEQQKDIDANLANFSKSLLEAHKDAHARLAAIPAAKRRLVTSFDTFRYFAVAYGFQVNPIPGLGSGNPRPAAMERLLALITQLRAPAVFLESAANARSLQMINTETGAKTCTTLVAEGLGPTGSYLGMFKANVNAIVEALK